ncbi:MAG: diguanylate cyclase [Myxococcales bacterium]|nr:diguanylate cyclase [Myxococcales bacterium]
MTNILVVDDSEDNLALISMLLEKDGFDVTKARRGEESLELAAHRLPDVILLDIGMPGIDGVETCRRFKSNPRTESIPIIMVSANDEDEHILASLEAGAWDYVSKPVKKRILLARVRSALRIKEAQDETARLLVELESRNEELAIMNERFKSLALEDGLTGLGNRRAMELELDNVHAIAMRFHRPYSVALFDIDYFKQYNDHYGHQAGDELLRKLSDRLTELLRKSDRIYRYGGEEFLLLFPECLPTGAAIITERICASVLDLGFEHCESDEGFVTISAGIAHEAALDRTRESWKTVVGEADKALYMAKDRGRNRVVLWRAGQD